MQTKNVFVSEGSRALFVHPDSCWKLKALVIGIVKFSFFEE